MRAPAPPIVIVTSNRTREIHDAIKRRCLYHWIDYPDAARELAILAARAPEVPARLARADRRVRPAAARDAICSSCPASPRRSTGATRSSRSAAVELDPGDGRGDARRAAQVPGRPRADLRAATARAMADAARDARQLTSSTSCACCGAPGSPSGRATRSTPSARSPRSTSCAREQFYGALHAVLVRRPRRSRAVRRGVPAVLARSDGRRRARSRCCCRRCGRRRTRTISRRLSEAWRPPTRRRGEPPSRSEPHASTRSSRTPPTRCCARATSIRCAPTSSRARAGWSARSTRALAMIATRRTRAAERGRHVDPRAHGARGAAPRRRARTPALAQRDRAPAGDRRAVRHLGLDGALLRDAAALPAHAARAPRRAATSSCSRRT